MGYKECLIDTVKMIVGALDLYFQLIVYQIKKRFGMFKFNEEDVSGKVVVVTGGSNGMGKASAKQFAKRGATVIIGDVDMAEGEKTVQEIQNETGNPNVILFHLDLSDMDSVQEFAKKVALEYPKIKILLNNAGILQYPSTFHRKSKDGFNMSVAVNYLGHFLLTNLLLPNIQRENKPRIVSMSSTTQLASRFDLNDLMMEKTQAFQRFCILPYRNTKYCVALFTKELSKIVAEKGIHVYALCPGVASTNIFQVKDFNSLTRFCIKISLIVYSMGMSPDEAAANCILYCALDKSIENETGKIYRFRKQFSAANKRLDDNLARELWAKSDQLVNLQRRLSSFK